jgi:hypothetical protein
VSPRGCGNGACTVCATVRGLRRRDRAVARSACGGGWASARRPEPLAVERLRSREPPGSCRLQSPGPGAIAATAKHSHPTASRRGAPGQQSDRPLPQQSGRIWPSRCRRSSRQAGPRAGRRFGRRAQARPRRGRDPASTCSTASRAACSKHSGGRCFSGEPATRVGRSPVAAVGFQIARAGVSLTCPRRRQSRSAPRVRGSACGGGLVRYWSSSVTQSGSDPAKATSRS